MTSKMNSMSKIQQDSEQISQDSSNHEKVRRYEPLGLNADQLKARLHSLKDYSTYKQTKNLRVNIAALKQSQDVPIVSTALDYGARQGKNEVLPDYISTQDSGQQLNNSNIFEALFHSSHEKRHKVSGSSDPSFIKYKTIEQKERARVFSMINASNNHHKKNRYITEVNSSQASQINSRQKVVPVPKQLRKLKNRLSLLPVLRKQPNSSEQNKQPDLQENRTISIAQSQTNDINFVTEKQEQINIKIDNGNKNFSVKRYGRQDYLKEMKQILDKSKTQIGVLTEEQKQQLKDVTKSENDRKKKSKKLEYWPNYAQYSLTKKEEAKIQKIKERFSSFNPEKASVAPELRQMQQMIKQQISWQQSCINRELVTQERDMLGHKFGYLFELEQQNYKRNIKELIKCKKQYTIQKQREQIRANGIKRMKIIGTLGGHKQVIQPSPIPTDQD